MSLDQFEMILYDMYQADIWLPPYQGKWRKEFKKTSYSSWAINELQVYITNKIKPRTEVSIDELIDLTYSFSERMYRFSKVNPNTKFIFQTAIQMIDNVLDLLQDIA